MQSRITGTIEHIIFRNEDNGYSVFTIISDGKELTCVGSFQSLQEGLSIEAVGEMTEHPVYGEQFKVSEMELKIPETKEAMERYLASGAIKGIGKAMAARIVKKFGDQTLEILEDEPERLAEVRGISEKKARDVARQVAAQAGMRKAMMFLQKYGISQKMGVRIYKAYGEDMYEILEKNPYKMAEDIEGIGFRTADDIAEKVGIPAHSEYRIRSGVFYVLTQASADGSVYLPEDVLIRRSSDLLHATEEEIQKAEADLAVDHKVVIKEHETEDGTEKIIYAGQFYYLELNTARRLLDLNTRSRESEGEVETHLKRLEKSGKIKLAGEQREAIKKSALHNVLILTGGPGTGKTTTINEIIRYLRMENQSVMLAAPTGRAAKRMTETTGYEAQTIHRLLEIDAGDHSIDDHPHFERNEEKPLETDAVIIDEMSMVDIFLMNALVSAISVGTKLILVGDVNQLPSVGPGAVLKDMIASGAFPCVKLTKIFRQAEQSDIVVNAHKIHDGIVPSFDNKSRDFFLLKRNDANLIISNMIELIQKFLPKYVHARPADIQVLVPMRNGALGVSRINRILQQYLNPPSKGKKEKTYGDKLFRVGDKVMQVRNDYQLEWEIRGRYNTVVETGSGIFNGDMGVIRAIDEDASSLEIEFDEGRFVFYPFNDLDELELSYAITIHKSQGSEYPAVLLPVLSGPTMLMTRNLLYTAVTRAKKCVVLLGSEEAFRSMIGNVTEMRRYTSLDERICELKGGSEEKET